MTLQDQLGVLQGLAALAATAAFIVLFVPDAGLWVARQLRAHSVAQRAARSAYRMVRATDLELGPDGKAGHDAVVTIGRTEREAGGKQYTQGLQMREASTLCGSEEPAEPPVPGGSAA